MRRAVVSTLMASLLLLSGCATDNRSDALSHILIQYANTVRWDGFEAAQQFIDPKVREAHPLSSLDRERYKQVRVSEYDDGDGPIPVSKNEVRQNVQLGLVNIHTQTERSVVDRQLWRYDEEKKHWWLETPTPDITQN